MAPGASPPSQSNISIGSTSSRTPLGHRGWEGGRSVRNSGGERRPGPAVIKLSVRKLSFIYNCFP